MTKISDDGKTLRTVERALQFMEAVAQSTEPPKIKDVAVALGLNITTGYHLLKTLQKAGYINRDGSGCLRIGRRITVLHEGMMRQSVLERDLQTVIVKLSATILETAYLSTLTSEGLVVATLVEGNQAVRVAGLHVGFSGAEYIRASGKAVLAFLDEPEREAFLVKSLSEVPLRNRRNIVNGLDDEITLIRSRGWALDDQAFEKGVCCVAAPFFQANGTVGGSVGISVPVGRFEDSAETLTTAVRAAARLASQILGYEGDLGGCV